jgi:5-methylcytosine-specific restriction endonuclease McrA
MADGLNSWCRACHKTYMAERRARPEVKAHENEERFRRKTDPASRAKDLACYRRVNKRRRAEPDFIDWERGVSARAIAKRGARMLGAGSDYSASDIAALKALYAGLCAYCCGPSEVIDHVHPIARGGPNRLANLVPACRFCNQSKSDTPLLVWMARHIPLATVMQHV